MTIFGWYGRADRRRTAPRTSLPDTDDGGAVFPKRDADINATWGQPIIGGAAAYRRQPGWPAV